jgi:transposase
MKREKRFYSKEFKEKAILLSYQRANIKELADELGVSVVRIYKWRAQKKELEQPQLISSKQKKEEDIELKQLKKELKNTQLELEILKKAIHIFSKRDGSSINL